MEILGYIAAALIGGSLGLIGAGGSILTVPVMVYFFDVPVLLASSYSLAIVGFTSLVGASGKYRQGEVRTKIALLFSITSVLVVSIVRHYLVPVIPHELFVVKGVSVEYAAFSMVLFALLMIIAAASMIRGRKYCEEKEVCHTVSLPAVLLSSIAVGLVTGLLGAGGGFLIVPAMVFLFKLPMKEAVGTSLFIIAINSILGFTMDLSHFHIDWIFLLTFTGIAALGIIAGMMAGKKIPGQKLKTAFGWFVMVIGIVILSREVGQFFLNGKHGDTETQRHRDTETRRHRDTETRRHRDMETRRHGDTGGILKT